MPRATTCLPLNPYRGICAIAKKIFLRRVGSCLADRTRWRRAPCPAFLDRNYVRIFDAILWMRSYRIHFWSAHGLRRYVLNKPMAHTKGFHGAFGIRVFQLDEAGNYQYHAFGCLSSHCTSLNQRAGDFPYSTFLALSVDSAGHCAIFAGCPTWMVRQLWLLRSADYSSVRRKLWQERHQIVRCWMAHHQG